MFTNPLGYSLSSSNDVTGQKILTPMDMEGLGVEINCHIYTQQWQSYFCNPTFDLTNLTTTDWVQSLAIEGPVVVIAIM